MTAKKFGNAGKALGSPFDNPILEEARLLARGKPAELRWHAYSVKQARWPQAERVLLRRGNGQDIAWYAINVVKGRWMAAEARLLRKGHPDELARYALWAMKERWPQAEPSIEGCHDETARIRYAERLLPVDAWARPKKAKAAPAAAADGDTLIGVPAPVKPPGAHRKCARK